MISKKILNKSLLRQIEMNTLFISEFVRTILESKVIINILDKNGLKILSSSGNNIDIILNSEDMYPIKIMYNGIEVSEHILPYEALVTVDRLYKRK